MVEHRQPVDLAEQLRAALEMGDDAPPTCIVGEAKHWLAVARQQQGLVQQIRTELDLADGATDDQTVTEVRAWRESGMERMQLSTALSELIGLSGPMDGKDDAYTFVMAMVEQTADELHALHNAMPTACTVLNAIAHRLGAVARIANVLTHGKAVI